MSIPGSHAEYGKGEARAEARRIRKETKKPQSPKDFTITVHDIRINIRRPYTTTAESGGTRGGDGVKEMTTIHLDDIRLHIRPAGRNRFPTGTDTARDRFISQICFKGTIYN